MNGPVAVGLAWHHVRRRRGQWCAVALVETVVAVLTTWSLGLVIAAAKTHTELGTEYANIGAVQLAFVVLTGVACLSVTTRMVVAMCRIEIAQWQLAGLPPAWTAGIELMLVQGCALLGCSAGALVGALAWPWFGELVGSSGLPSFDPLHAAIPAAAVWAGWSASTGTALLAGLSTIRASDCSRNSACMTTCTGG